MQKQIVFAGVIIAASSLSIPKLNRYNNEDHNPTFINYSLLFIH
jgi:hypothetical protein